MIRRVATVVSAESELRRLPASLNTRQAMFFDGVRYSIEMADLSFRHCGSALLAMSHQERDIDVSPLPAAVLAAWGFVDSVNRLRLLLSRMPRIKSSPAMKLFRRKLAPFEDLRNPIQHLDGAINQHSESGPPTWGTLTWLVPTPDPDDEVDLRAFIAVPGAMRPMEDLAPVDFNRKRGIAYPIDMIELTAFGVTLSLSDVHRAIIEFVPKFETAVAEAFRGEDVRLGSDLVLELSLGLVEEDR